ncbi:MAG: 5-(carboxyamino)imidazole ribonucleotide synthase, partial [Terriglobia bacterium]
VLGGGQLGRMMALAGYPLGLGLRFLDHAADPPASQVAECITAEFDDRDALTRFADGLDVITYEFENVPASAAQFLAARVPLFFPPPRALEIAQDRYAQKTFFQEIGVPAPAFRPVSTRGELESAIEVTGLPAILKTRRWGYDGKGQFMLREPGDLDRAWQTMGRSPLVLESFVRFHREISLVSVRSVGGEVAFYPLTENHHREGILRFSLAPAPRVSSELQKCTQSFAEKIFAALNYTGVLTLEMFETERGILANEMATRVHNSGHWTIEGAETSQFENHLRAITGLPLGSAEATGCCAMVNFIGSLPEPGEALAIPGVHLHVYYKRARAGRKLGHATLCARSPNGLADSLARLRKLASC